MPNLVSKITSITTAQWEKRDGTQTYVLYGLTEYGTVYRYNGYRGGWIALSMRELSVNEDDND